MSYSENPYEWLTLDDEEEIIWEGSPAIETRAGQILGAIPFILLFGVGLLIIGWHYLILKHTEYVITTKAIYHKQGLYSRDVQKIPISNIQDTGFRETAAGRFFGFGTLEISTAGSGGVEMELQGVDDPQSVQSLLNKHMNPDQSNTLGVDEDGDPVQRTHNLNVDQLETYLTEVKQTRKSLETLRDNLD